MNCTAYVPAGSFACVIKPNGACVEHVTRRALRVPASALSADRESNMVSFTVDGFRVTVSKQALRW